MECPKCSAVLKTGARYCEICGTTVDRERLALESMSMTMACSTNKSS